MNLRTREIKVQGRLCRIAHVDGDGYKSLDSPAPVLAELRRHKTRVDLFIFIEKLPKTLPKCINIVEWAIWLSHLPPGLVGIADRVQGMEQSRAN